MSRDWEEFYRRGETPWEKGSHAPPLDEVIERFGAALWGSGGVLVPGCGLGHDVRRIAGLGVPAVGVDLAPSAVEVARRMSEGFAVEFEHGDFLDPDWVAGRSFTAIWEHTCFCAIHPTLRDRYVESTAALLAPGTVLAGVFYLTPHDPGEDETDGPPFKTSVGELEERFGRYFEKIDGWVPRDAYPGREGREWVGIFRRRA